MKYKVKKIITEYTTTRDNESLDSFLASSHYQREICYVIKGKCDYMLNNRVFPARPGTVFMINNWISHAFGYRPEDSDLVHLWLHFTDKAYASLVSVKDKGVIQWLAHIDLPAELETMLLTAWDHFSGQKDAAIQPVQDFLLEPLNTVLEYIHTNLKDYEKQSAAVLNTAVIEAVKRYIFISNARNCSLQHLEQVSGYNRFYLARRFKEYENCTIGDYINKVRIDYVNEALKNGIRQKEIAFELGFSSPANFWLWLKNHRQELNIEQK